MEVKRMIYGYARVSTVKQMKNGNSIDEQKAKLIEAGVQEIITDSYTAVSYTHLRAHET